MVTSIVCHHGYKHCLMVSVVSVMSWYNGVLFCFVLMMVMVMVLMVVGVPRGLRCAFSVNIHSFFYIRNLSTHIALKVS